MHALVLFLITAAPASPRNPEVSLLVAGDVTLGYHYEEYVDERVKKGDPVEQAQTWGFRKVQELTRKADFFVVNLECPFTTQGEKIAKNFNFRARPELVSALVFGGVDVVSLANNHMLDYGPVGLFDTASTLDAHGIRRFGAGRSLSEARQPAIVERNGVIIAFLGYFFLGERNIEPAEVIATDAQPGVAGHFTSTDAMKAMLSADIRAAKTKANHVIPFFHWGRESKGTPERYQVDLAHHAIEAGASAVIGSHPHVLQGIELYRGAPIVYSLGNFVFGGNWDPKDKKTALVEFSVTKRAVTLTKIHPARSDAFPDAPVQPYLAEGAQAEEVLQHLASLSGGFPSTIPQLRSIKPSAPSDAGH